MARLLVRLRSAPPVHDRRTNASATSPARADGPSHPQKQAVFPRAVAKRPLDILELARRLPLSEKLRCLQSYLLRPRGIEDKNFQAYVLRRYGEGLYSLFFRPYTEKLFGIPGDEISVHWAKAKVRLANPLDTFRENTKTKFNYFYYPILGGYGSIAESLYKEIDADVQTQATVDNLITEGDRVVALNYHRGSEEISLPVDAVISTLPLPILARMVDINIPLDFRAVSAVYLWIRRPRVSPYHWQYFIDDDISINRLVEFKNMSNAGVPEDTTVLCAEVTQSHPNVAERVVDDLVRAKVISRAEVLDTKVIQERFAYPIYNRQFDRALPIKQDLIGRYRNLYMLGHAAEFVHREVDDLFTTARGLIPNIVEGLGLMPKKQPVPTAIASDAAGPPAVHAVVLALNNYGDTRECIESLLQTTYPNLKIILVDNGSIDGTPNRAAEDFKDTLTVISTKMNLGVPAGYNVGFSHALKAGADYVLLLNNDTVIAPDMIEILVDRGEQDTNVGILMPKVLLYGHENKIWSVGGRYRQFPPSIILTPKDQSLADIPRLIEYTPGCGLLIHRRAFERVGLFDPGYLYWYDDWDFSERVRTHGLTIRYEPDAEMWHKVSKTLRGTGASQFWRTYGASAVRFFRRHGRGSHLSLPLNISYIMLREFLWKRNWRYLPEFMAGMREGLTKPLGAFPKVDP